MDDGNILIRSNTKQGMFEQTILKCPPNAKMSCVVCESAVILSSTVSQSRSFH